MATAEQYANWIVSNQDKKGTPEFETVAEAYKVARNEPATQAIQQPIQQPVEQSQSYNPTDDMNFGQTTLAGIGKAFVDTGRGVKQLGAQIGNKIGLVDDSTVQNIQNDINAYAELDKPLMRTAGGVLGNIAGQATQYAVPAGVIGKAPAVANAARTTIGKFLLAGAGGGAFGAIQPVSKEDTRLGQASLGAAGGMIGQGVASGVGKLASSSNISEPVKELAKKAKSRGIDIRAEQLVNSKPLNVVSASLDYVPFSGSGASKAIQQKQFNKAIANTLGEKTDDIAQAIKNADARLSNEFDFILKKTAVKADNQLQDDLIRVVNDARSEMTDAQFSVVERQVSNLLNKVKEGDVIDADAAYNIKKGLDRLSKSNDTTLSYYARDIRGSLMDALNRSLPDGGEAFAKTRKQYANLREIEKLAPKGADVDISPARLANARNLKTDDLKELADISAQFLKPRVGDSGTAQRAGVYGLLGAGTAIDPTSAAIGLTAGRAANKALTSKTLANYLYKGIPALQGEAPKRLLPAVGTSLMLD